MEPSRMRSLLVYLKNMMYSVSSDPSRDQSQFIFTVVPGEIGTRWANPSWIHPTHTYLSNLSCFHPTHTYLSNLSCFHPTLPMFRQSSPSCIHPTRPGFILLFSEFIQPFFDSFLQPFLDPSNPSWIHLTLPWFIQSFIDSSNLSYIYTLYIDTTLL